MKIGTKSVLFGAHQFIIHPICVAIAWKRLYGFPWHPMLWLCFLVHDIGYIGCTNMDGDSGKYHPRFGARIIGLFGGKKWADFCARHSRSYARLVGGKPSRLCAADKLAFLVEPIWFYKLRCSLTGELAEYIQNCYSIPGFFDAVFLTNRCSTCWSHCVDVKSLTKCVEQHKFNLWYAAVAIDIACSILQITEDEKHA